MMVMGSEFNSDAVIKHHQPVEIPIRVGTGYHKPFAFKANFYCYSIPSLHWAVNVLSDLILMQCTACKVLFQEVVNLGVNKNYFLFL